MFKIFCYPILFLVGVLKFTAAQANYEILYSDYSVTDINPIIGTGKVKKINSDNSFWLQTENNDLFERFMKVSSMNNFRKNKQTFRIKAYGANNLYFKSSDSKAMQALYKESLTIKKMFEGKKVSFYCGSKDGDLVPNCIIYTYLNNKKGESVKVSFNDLIISSGYSPFEIDKEIENYDIMDKTISLFIDKAKVNGYGIYSKKVTILPEDF